MVFGCGERLLFVNENTADLIWVVIEYAFFFCFFLRNRFLLLIISQYKQIYNFDSLVVSTNYYLTVVETFVCLHDL